MTRSHGTAFVLVAVVLGLAPGRAAGDRQLVAPGGGSQVSVVVDAGTNGICETSGQRDDVQVLAVGQSLPFTTAVQCGPNKTADTPAAGDDRQLIAVGAACPNANADVIDTGPDGVANSTSAGDDRQVLALATGTANTACIRTGPNGRADTSTTPGGDDVRLLALGAAEANTIVVRCGANRVAETFANNARAGGDDVQLVAVGGACGNTSTAVVDSGANGIVETRAQGAELLILPARPRRIVIRRGRNSASVRVKVAVLNFEFGTTAAPARGFSLVADDGSCPNGTVIQVDADARTPGVQLTGAAPRRGRAKGSAVVTFEVGDITSVDRRLPFRCAVTLTATATDTAPIADDASNPTNNTARVELEVSDQNDL